jgi:hypothetical protein
MTSFILPSFSKNTRNKIGKYVHVSGKNTLFKTIGGWRVAIADEPLDAKVDGKKFFCVRVDDAGIYSLITIGFTPMETFDSNKNGYFGEYGFTGCGINLYNGYLCYPGSKYHNIIDRETSSKSKEVIVILTISSNGKKKEIRFICDGKETQSSDVSEHLNGDFFFPAISLYDKNQQVTTIPIEEIKTRTPEIENLIKEYQQQQNKQTNASDFEVETKKENEKEKKVKQVATKKTKKETKPKTTKATKKKEETKKEKKTKAKK